MKPVDTVIVNEVRRKFEICIYGQVMGGKNNMCVSRSGHHYPTRKWAEWRDMVVTQMVEQVFGYRFASPCRITLNYWKGDRRRRDVPGMEDAIWHCLERAGIVSDDKILEEVHWIIKGIDRKNPRVEIEIEELS